MPFIQFDRFEKWYGKLCAVAPLDLTIDEGETFALLGPNGGGKSTIIRAMVGLHAPSAGRILLNGTDIVRHPREARHLISYLPQRVTMPGRMTAREIVRLSAALKRANSNKIDEALDYVALTADADRYVGEYSGGMLQRLGLAIALLGDPELLVLDEPTLNLDPLGRDKFLSLILDLKKSGTTVILSSHIMQDAERLADRIGVLVEGKLVSVKSVAQFRESISRETSVRIILERMDDSVTTAARNAGATYTSWDGEQFLFQAPPERRLEVIRAIEATGVEVKEFHSEPPNWDALFHKDNNDSAHE